MTRGVSLVSGKLDGGTARARSRTYGDLAQSFARPREGLVAEYARLFVGPGPPAAHPYESVYRERQVMGNCSLAVHQRYAEEGLAPQDHLLPDHVAVELEFMAHLASKEAEAWEQGDHDGAEACLVRQELFLQEHLGRWLPSFCQRVLVSEAHPFYADLAQRAWDHVAEDLAGLRSWLRAAAEGSTGKDHSWTLTVGSECTLCGTCVRLCEGKALRVSQEKNQICLLFDPVACDGCAACQQWCPERVVTVEPSPHAEGESVLLMCSPLVNCAGCGQPYLPAALLARVQEQAAADTEGLGRQLTMCPACKGSSPISSLGKED